MEPTEDLDLVLTALYLSEINCSVASFFDEGWTAMLGDPNNGYKAQESGLYSTSQVAEWLTDQACQYYPRSDFAQNRHELPMWIVNRALEQIYPTGSTEETK